ncbi:hypothetical protein GWK16_13805 [Roseomonas sp. JC162]|uniref:Uncharacterized protein n=1 Tax=Neoroseomonas marina TaxID=1232220 RepID=A0A848ECP1_9PROT|nr:hypothetical protein [Neoroseomonas marina]NMJ42324.1 hypothetical protein [Neoroseomonas marina]
MSSNLITALHQEERSIIAELRASRLFQRLEGVRKLLSLYDAQPSVTTGIDGLAEGERAPAAAAPLRMVQPQAAPVMGSQPIPMPGPADVVSHEPVRAQAAGETAAEAGSVVSSVRAALLGIGKP